MTTVIAVVIAVVGGFVQTRRHPGRLPADVHLVWWMVWVVGVASIVAAGSHIFAGPQTAEMIGYTRGDGGFQCAGRVGTPSRTGPPSPQPSPGPAPR